MYQFKITNPKLLIGIIMIGMRYMSRMHKMCRFCILMQSPHIDLSRQVTCVGHIVGAIVADTQAHAQRAAKAVKISYEELQPVIVTIQVCIYSTFTRTLTTANRIFQLWNNAFVMCGRQNPNATQLASSQKGLYLQNQNLRSDTKTGASDQTSAHRAGKQKTQTGEG